MVDYNEIMNALNDLKPRQQNATLKINVPNIVRSVPNYRTEQLINSSKNFAKGAGTLGASIPFYKNVAFPVANDLYNGMIKGDVDKSKILQFFMDIAGIDKNGNKIINRETQSIDSTKGGIKDSNLDKGLVPMEALDMAGESDLLSIPPKLNQTTKQQAQNIVNSVNNKTLNESPIEGSTTRVPSEDDINTLKDYILQLQGVRQPYVNALESYLKNYYKNLDQARRADLYFYGANLAKGLNPKAGEKFNPLQNQADIINTIKLISDAKAGDINAINELQGNMAIADQIDLPPEAAFANKNLLTALSQDRRFATDLEKARIVDAMRRYGYDTNFLRTLIAQGMKGDTAEKVARIYMGEDGQPGVGLTQGGVPAQQQTYSPLPQQDAYAQAFAQYANKRK